MANSATSDRAPNSALPRAEDLAAWALTHAEHPAGRLPVHIPRVTQRLGVARIVRIPGSRGAGQLRDGDTDSPWIVLPGAAGDAPFTGRETFTIAHELGHLLLFRRHRLPIREQLESAEVERFCDRFAAQLLLPAAALSRWAEEPATLETLLRVSATAAVGRVTALTALEEHAGWAHNLIRWRDTSDGIELSDTSLSYGRDNTIGTAPATAAVLQALGRPRRPKDVALPVRSHGNDILVNAEVVWERGHWLALVRSVDLDIADRRSRMRAP